MGAVRRSIWETGWEKQWCVVLLTFFCAAISFLFLDVLKPIAVVILLKMYNNVQEESFKEFLSRPENQPILEKHQRREVKQAIQLQEKVNALNFRSKVLEADYEAQIAIAPFLKNKMLKRVVQTFANDPNGDFEKWAKNPRVIEMLRSAQKMMDEGRVTEDEMEEFILRMMRDPSYEHHAEFEAKTKQVARLPTDQLVQALNEHVRNICIDCVLSWMRVKK